MFGVTTTHACFITGLGQPIDVPGERRSLSLFWSWEKMEAVVLKSTEAESSESV